MIDKPDDETWRYVWEPGDIEITPKPKKSDDKAFDPEAKISDAVKDRIEKE